MKLILIAAIALTPVTAFAFGHGYCKKWASVYWQAAFYRKTFPPMTTTSLIVFNAQKGAGLSKKGIRSVVQDVYFDSKYAHLTASEVGRLAYKECVADKPGQ